MTAEAELVGIAFGAGEEGAVVDVIAVSVIEVAGQTVAADAVAQDVARWAAP
jgi:hypothetical protein